MTARPTRGGRPTRTATPPPDPPEPDRIGPAFSEALRAVYDLEEVLIDALHEPGGVPPPPRGSAFHGPPPDGSRRSAGRCGSNSNVSWMPPAAPADRYT